MANCGRRLLPNFIDEIAAEKPDLTFVEIPKSTDMSDGLYRISFRDLAGSIDKCAWWIHSQLGTGHGFPTLAYIGPHDLRYLFLVFGACKAGYKMLFASPRNSTAALLDLLIQADCNTFLMPADAPLYSNLLMSVLAERPMQTLDLPDLAYFLDVNTTTKCYPWHRTFEDVKHDPLAVFHTSGSTGMPKLITMNHGAVASLDAFRNIKTLTGHMIQTDAYKGKRTLLLFPMFHASAISTLFLSLWNTVPTVLPPPIPLTAGVANDMLINCNIEASIMPPSILAEIAGNQEYLENLWKCDSVMYGGGPLPTEAGNRIASGTTLITIFGASETGFFPVEVMRQSNWRYVKLSAFAGGVYRPYTDNLYELVIERQHELKSYQSVFWLFPDLQEYHTKDLFAKHPNEADLWLWQGRMDDIIVLSNGEKFNPTSMEDMINTHPGVESALVCGQGRDQCALLVELSSTESSEEDKTEEEVVEELWPAVEKANEKSPEYGRLMKDMVIVAKPGKRMVRADKGTVQRKPTLETFAAELDALYHLHDPDASSAQIDRPMDLASVKQTVTRIVQNISRYKTAQSSKSFVDLGIDSLHAMTIARNLRTAFLESPMPITTKTIYDYPSIDLLAYFICGLSTGQEDSVKTMQMLYDRYSPMSRQILSLETSRDASVLLVGSTGHLGTQLLVQLSRRQDVKSIYCLTRDPHASLKQGALNLPLADVASTYIRYFHANYSQPRFGLSESDWLMLQNEVTHVIQNAWPVDFCMPLSHFEPSIRVTAEVMDFCKSADHSPTFVFISSIGSVLGSSKDVVTEEVVHDWLSAENMGYTQSKLVAERLIATTAATTGVKSVICRVGQLGGVLNHELWKDKVPQWPETGWLPALLASSIQLCAIPSSLGSLDRIDWLPVDVAGSILCELMSAASAIHEVCQVYNIVNPDSTTWQGLLSKLKAYEDLEKVALVDWVALLRNYMNNGQESNVPALRLIDFFERACGDATTKPMVDCSKSLAMSPTLASTQRISLDLMERWISQWSFSR
ncbi:acetyl-CoA synthetase-like protein [Aureobasidium sp. EXF-10727]|nr:acetyl-CoA synthetase-like protein [Aureobasidium sp. EXF-10727]KAI4730544.1 acetyl-CoA synthetase-like protein [Aureobasidium sp. EXF-10728]